MRQQPGSPSGYGQTVCKLVKSPCGVEQASRLWHAELSTMLEQVEFAFCAGDPGLFKEGEPPVFLRVYVDYLLMEKGV